MLCGVAWYGMALWVWVCSLGMGSLHAMRWSSATLSAILRKVVSRSLPNSSHKVPDLSTVMLPIAP